MVHNNAIEAKLLYFFISKLRPRYQLTLVSLMYLFCLLLLHFTKVPEVFFYQHTLLMMPYLCVGNLAKTHKESIKRIIPKLAFYGVVVLLTEFSFGFPIPSQDANIGISLLSFPLHVVNVFLGTSIIIYFSKCISHCRFLATLGYGSLLVYLLNGVLIKSSLLLLLPFHYSNSRFLCSLYYLVVYIIILIVSYYAVKFVYNNKCLRWIVGKW